MTLGVSRRRHLVDLRGRSPGGCRRDLAGPLAGHPVDQEGRRVTGSRAAPRRMKVGRAPGRVSLIGEHTDYNDGFVLPVPLDRYTTVVAHAREDRTITVEATDLGESDSFDLDAIEPTGTWADYVRGVIALLELTHGADLRIESTVPREAGLSSSAALEVAVGRALSDLPGPELALLAQRAENEFVGVQCGIMDQFTSANGLAGHALLLDCRDLSYRHVAIPDGVAVVVCDSRIERRLSASEYN